MDLLTTKEVSDLLHVSVRVVRRKAKLGEIRCVMDGRRLRFRREDLDIPSSQKIVLGQEGLLIGDEDSGEEYTEGAEMFREMLLKAKRA